MTAENQNEPPVQGRRDGINLGIQGNVDGGIVVGGDQNTIQKTIHQGPSYYNTTNFFGASQAEHGSEKSDYLRRNLLKQMKTDIALRLDDSLHNLIRVDLEQEEQRHQVGRRRKEALVEATPISPLAARELVQRELAVSNEDAVRVPIPPAEQTFKIFHRSDIGGRLLILGEPGAGKTTELLTIAQRLVDRAIEDSTEPIPLIFELSSWQPNAPILSWLGQQLKQAYGVSKKLAEPLAQQLIQQGQLLPLLDGLDELGQHNQIECIKALEEFLSQHPALPIIICCRREEYEQGGAQLNHLNGAIYLQAVGIQQIQQYLQALGRESLWEGIQADPELLKLARSPLFLTMLVIAYQGQPIRDTASLFNAYIHKQLHDSNHQGTYQPGKEKSPEQTLHYLGWLARQLNQRNETEFLIENLQPDWLGDQHKIQTYRLWGGLSFGLSFGLWGGLLGGLWGGLSFGLWGGLFGGLFGGLWGGLLGGLIGGLSFGLSFGLWGGLIGRLRGGLWGGLIGGLGKIQPKEQLKWSLRNGLWGGLIFGLSFGLLGRLLGGLSFGLLGGLSGGLWGGLLGGLMDEAIDQKTVPNQGIQKSLRNGLSFGLWGGLIGGLSFGLSFGLRGGLSFGLIGGLIGGLWSGLWGGLWGGLGAAIQHFILRIFLTKEKNTPWNYARFLEHAARLRFIQRTGGRYRFVHDLLRQHFAQMTPQQQAVLAQENEG